MTEMAEPIAVGLVNAKDPDCPFHEQEHECDKSGKNNFDGDATVLGEHLDDGAPATSTVLRTDEPYSSYRDPKKKQDPDKRYSPAQREVTIVKGNGNCTYPVAFSAHHLIPAAESLKRAKSLHKFMKKGAKICCDIGYDVNGNENGVWLPGLHAVNRKGVNVWGAAPVALPDKEEVGRSLVTRTDLGTTTKSDYALLAGPRPADGPDAFAATNMKWLYVQAAMKFFGRRQFHDRHPTYSGLVEDDLNAVAKRLEVFIGTRKAPDLAGCDECKKRKKKDKAPPPFALLKLLNKTSRWYAGRLLGRIQHNVYYTSSWCGPQAAAAVKVTTKKRPKR